MANGPLKTSLAKFSSHFAGLAVLFFSGYVRLTVSIFIRSSLEVSCGVKGFEAPIRLFVFINDFFLSLDIEFQ